MATPNRPPLERLIGQVSAVAHAAVGLDLDRAQAVELLDRIGFLENGEPAFRVEPLASKGTRDWMLAGLLELILNRPAAIDEPFDVPTWCEFRCKAEGAGYRFAGRRGEPPYLVTATALPVHLRPDWPDLLAAIRAEFRTIH